MPQKQRYKINIIPCNSGGLSKRAITKSRSADDMDVVVLSESETISPEKKVRQMPEIIAPLNALANKHISMIATRARTVERKHKKMKSYIDIKIGAESFISEKSGKFSDYYRIMSRIGEGGYGQVFKVQHKKTGLIRAMKSRP